MHLHALTASVSAASVQFKPNRASIFRHFRLIQRRRLEIVGPHQTAQLRGRAARRTRGGPNVVQWPESVDVHQQRCLFNDHLYNYRCESVVNNMIALEQLVQHTFVDAVRTSYAPSTYMATLRGCRLIAPKKRSASNKCSWHLYICRLWPHIAGNKYGPGGHHHLCGHRNSHFPDIACRFWQIIHAQHKVCVGVCTASILHGFAAARPKAGTSSGKSAFAAHT